MLYKCFNGHEIGYKSLVAFRLHTIIRDYTIKYGVFSVMIVLRWLHDLKKEYSTTPKQDVLS